ncbi:hypothetical protein ETAA1_44610 [Urbifossiella limnaea]|uniref:Uncharacterized protein n=2 Tax=Urbifossiella limnaea TaxID=2528023 RepID=A0A517XY72_9BACT|nr:hypothetical protein ETAA1_44610 [Urbifossiella limnaea]
METSCYFCRAPRPRGAARCHCGYEYAPSPRPGPHAPTDPEFVHDGMPTIHPGSLFDALMLLVMTGINATSVAVVGMAALITAVAVAGLEVGGGWIALTFGAATIGCDLLSRRMLRASLWDTTRGSEMLKVPAWNIGALIFVVAGAILIID